MFKVHPLQTYYKAMLKYTTQPCIQGYVKYTSRPDIKPKFNSPIENHTKMAFEKKLFLLTGVTQFFTDSYGDWNHLLISSFDGKRVCIFRTGHTVGDSGSITSHHTGRKHVVNFCFNHLPVNLLWLSWIIASHNYDQSKFNLMCYILPRFNLWSELDGPHFSYIKNTAIYRLGMEGKFYLVVWYLWVLQVITNLSF